MCLSLGEEQKKRSMMTSKDSLESTGVPVARPLNLMEGV